LYDSVTPSSFIEAISPMSMSSLVSMVPC
jgi:hypothetical protein